ncbi:MAG: molybdopterin-dependent oxidoreductase, partial [Hyphomicrobiales bacterium]|nr:molybdopterin-dependent oxidoreductase [Hyphomicrobiales bacterium]
MLRKKTGGVAIGPRLSSALSELTGGAIDRRTFLKRSGLTAGGLAAAATLTGGMVQKAQAQSANPGNIEIKKSVCTHCSVGCTVMAEVQDGVWVGQEPGYDSPFNLGAHCAKGASVREHAHGERRLKYPMKLVDGKWQKMNWDDAINEVGDRLMKIRDTAGPDSVYWLGSAKHNNEQAYLFRKLYAFWGSNNGDHQARICHSTTVAGVANTWGYGAMTNSYNDIHNSRAIFLIGGNPAEAHPVSLLHLMKAKEENNAAVIVCDPRFTRTAAHATEYVRFRPGTDVALIWGILWHVFENGWEDQDYINKRVWGIEYIKEEVKKWTPEEVEKVAGVPPSQMKRVARTMAQNKPGTFIWCMGGTQHTNGNNNTRAYCAMQLVLGNIGRSGGGANIFRGHDNVQGATDFCVLSHSLPGYYGLKTGSWKHWARVWDVEYDYLLGRFADKKLMESKGIPVSRWIDGVLEDKANIDQPENVQGMVFWGHAPNSQTRLPEMQKAMAKLDTLVVIDPYPTMTAAMHTRKNGVYLLPAATQFETYGSVTASNRSLQWRETVVNPLFESLPDQTIMYKLAKKFGFEKEMFKNIKVENDEPSMEETTLEFNKGMWTIGYTGQSPDRLKKHMANQHTFDRTTLRANGGPCDGEYYGLPWPCWGTAEMGHPGTPNLYDPSQPVAEGGLNFRARFGVKAPDDWGGGNLLAEGDVEGVSYPVGAEIKGGHPEFTMAMLKKLGWDSDLTDGERAAIDKVAGDKTNWKTDLSGGIQRVAIKHGCAPFGNAKARTVVWTFPDPIPLHREPLYTPRRDLLPKYETYADKQAYRLPTKYASIQKNDYSKDFPIILTSGRLVEYEGGGD